MAVAAVVFDVGETLVDETRHWGLWADWMGVPRLTFFAALGALIERGRHHREVFELVRPGFDPEQEMANRIAQGYRHTFERGDFYPDALPCLERLKTQGYRIGLAGNQPEMAGEALKGAGLPVDFIATSAGWGVEKPSPLFFRKVAEAAGFPPSAVAYVGDRLDNDAGPARTAGMVSVFIRRGPWGLIQASGRQGEAPKGTIALESLDELPAALV